MSLLRALINVAKSSLTKSSPVNDCPAKKTRRQIIPAQSSEDNNITARSPMSESSPSQSVPMESPVQVFIFSIHHSFHFPVDSIIYYVNYLPL